jgi:hypothetical protein
MLGQDRNLLDLGPAKLGPFHPTTLVNGGLTGEPFHETTIIQLAICLTFHPHMLFLFRSKIYLWQMDVKYKTLVEAYKLTFKQIM